MHWLGPAIGSGRDAVEAKLKWCMFLVAISVAPNPVKARMQDFTIGPRRDVLERSHGMTVSGRLKKVSR